ncbi:MAG TPA: sulfotransferase domain-containing protein [Patescibacteria group bacterium]|jgi:hypothetical protein|nr:sulfotransferase domain-containing protein [Patescibacteria group bacterium]
MSDFPTKGARPVWIASYPRSGNTFLRILLEKFFRLPSYSVYLVEGAKHRDPSAEALEDAPMLPMNWREHLTDSSQAPLVAIKTHDLPTDSAPAIFIVRDGRAAIDSYYHYHQKFAFEQPSLTEIIAGACQFGSWSEHYWAWRPRTRPNTLLVLYDDLVGSPRLIVDKLAQFLQLKPADTTLPGFQELQTRLPAFFRRGQNADYLKQWSAGHMALFNELHFSAMADLGFQITETKDSAGVVVKELAQSAARLHRLYLEQLTNIGRIQANHSIELQRLMGQIREFSRETDGWVNTLLKKPWIRFGLAIGVIRPPPSQIPHAPFLVDQMAPRRETIKPSA